MNAIDACNNCALKNCLMHDKGNFFNLTIQDHHFINKSKIFALEYKEPRSQVYPENLLKNTILKGTKFIYYLDW